MQAGLFSAWHDHLTPETGATATQPAAADTGLIVTESTYTVNYCLGTSLAKVTTGKEKHSLFYDASHLQNSGTSLSSVYFHSGHQLSRDILTN